MYKTVELLCVNIKSLSSQATLINMEENVLYGCNQKS